jgi:hypothetical protein
MQLKNILCIDLKIDKYGTYKFYGLTLKNIYFESDSD